MDRRLFPANARVAHESLRGAVHDVVFTAGIMKRVGVPVLDLDVSLPRSQGRRDRQRLMGEAVTVLEERDGQAFVICQDGYVGYVDADGLSDFNGVTHFVATMSTHSYEGEDFKSAALQHLPFGAKVDVLDERQKFFETSRGYIPKKHLRPIDRPFDDVATIAQLHFGVPYLWGGNSTRGIDCSGLIQSALNACEIDCPGDSDLQREGLGAPIPDGAPLTRGDLVFWKGHVGMMVDEATLIHANAHHMSCTYEPFAAACLRIEAQGDGPVLARKRLRDV